MKIERINNIEYSEIFKDHYIIYNTAEFNLLNRSKCERIEFFFFQEDNLKIGLIGGVKDNCLLAPFSAPFSSFSFEDDSTRTELIIRAITLLEEYLNSSNINVIKFILPPLFYNRNLISKLIFSFYQSKYSIIIDQNHCFYTKNFIKYENDTIRKGVRYNLRVANKNGLAFKKASTNDEYAIAYDVIRLNKEAMNRPLKMTFNQINDMKSMVDIDFFIVYYKDIPISSSIVYKYTPKIVQIIYWGAIPNYNCYYPMNFMAMNIFKYYRDIKIEIIDLGNSSSQGSPNFGLSNFKETIGCTSTLKFIFFKNLKGTNIVNYY
jgi:hypothetical protein